MTLLVSLFIALVAGLAPLALGSNRPLPWSYNAAAIGVIMLAAAAALLTDRRRHPDIGMATIALPLGLVMAGLLWAALQLVPIGSGWPSHPVWAFAGDVLGEPLAGRVSGSPIETGWALLRWATVIGLFCCVFFLARDAVNARVLFWSVICFAAVSAVYGLVRLSFSIDQLLWYPQPDPGVLSAGFINRNSAAMYFAMTAVAVYAAVIDRFRRSIRKSSEGMGLSTPEAVMQAITGKPGLMLLAFAVLAVACMATASRGGITAMAAGLIAVTIMYMLRSARLSSGGRSGWLGIILLAAIVAIVLFEVAGARLSERLDGDNAFSLSGRLDVYRNTLNAIGDYLLVGSGLGTFQDVYPAYRTDIASNAGIWDKAHNDYLELFLGLGVPAATAMIVAALVLALRLVSGFFRRHRDAYFTAAATGALVVAGLHSVVDFGLQMQANALTLALLTGCAAAQTESSRG